ncbi:MAG TPA: hypothetical protein DEO56_09180, partial [Nitrosomonas nitrosa]|nr:hypothetical protein [Nitrosomonas nitrosa]
MFQKNKNETKIQKLLIIDAGVLDSDLLLKDHHPDYKVIRLKPESDPIAQISKTLSLHAPVSEVSLVAHALPGQIHFSGGLIDSAQLEQHQQQLQAWRESLSPDASMRIYACQLAAGTEGEQFIDLLKQSAGVEVAASSLPMGNTKAGLNWDLDRFTQVFDVLMPFGKTAVATYSHTLAPTLTLTGGRVVEADSPSPSNNRNLEFTLKLTEAATQDVTFSYQTYSGTATQFIDFIRIQGVGVIQAGQDEAQLIVAVRGDTLDETDENFFLELGNLNGAEFADGGLTARAQGIIDDQDGAGSNRALFVSDPVIVEGDTGSRFATFTVSLSEPSSDAITLSYTTADGSALAGVDYTASNGVVHFEPNETEAEVSVEVLGDTLLEGDEHFSLVLTPTPAIANGVSDATGIATIRDDDAGSLPILSLTGGRVVEADSPSPSNFRDLEFTLHLSKPANQDISLNYHTLSGTATEDLDFLRAHNTLTIPAGQTTAILPIMVRGDEIDETDEDFFLELGNLSGAVFANGALTTRVQGIIDDQDGAGSNRALFVDNPVMVEGNTGVRAAEFTVRLTEPSADPISVNYTTSPGTAVSGTDYTPVSGTLTFLPGQTMAAVQVDVLGDTAVEASELFSLILSEPQNAVLGDGGSGREGIATILDDDAGSIFEPVISIDNGQVIETNSTSPSSFRDIEFIVRLSAPSSSTVTVDFATSDGTAEVADNDYLANTGTVTFQPGQTLKTLLVTARGDTQVEIDESFTVTLNNPVNASLAGDVDALNATGTIIDNDDEISTEGSPLLSVDDITVTERPGGATATFTLNLSNATFVAVGGQLQVVAGTATAGADFTAIASTPFIINAGDLSTTVSVNVLDDNLIEDTETFVLRVSDIINARLNGDTDTLFAIGEITDDDDTIAGVSVNAGSD